MRRTRLRTTAAVGVMERPVSITTRIPSACLPGVRPPFKASNRVKYPQKRQNISRIKTALNQPRAVPWEKKSPATVLPMSETPSSASICSNRSSSPAATREPTPASSKWTSTCSGVSTPWCSRRSRSRAEAAIHSFYRLSLRGATHELEHPSHAAGRNTRRELQHLPAPLRPLHAPEPDPGMAPDCRGHLPEPAVQQQSVRGTRALPGEPGPLDRFDLGGARDLERLQLAAQGRDDPHHLGFVSRPGAGARRLPAVRHGEDRSVAGRGTEQRAAADHSLLRERALRHPALFHRQNRG